VYLVLKISFAHLEVLHSHWRPSCLFKVFTNSSSSLYDVGIWNRFYCVFFTLKLWNLTDSSLSSLIIRHLQRQRQGKGKNRNRNMYKYSTLGCSNLKNVNRSCIFG
jgi:hypothetical protein